jgi:hypothetical protein
MAPQAEAKLNNPSISRAGKRPMAAAAEASSRRETHPHTDRVLRLAARCASRRRARPLGRIARGLHRSPAITRSSAITFGCLPSLPGGLPSRFSPHLVAIVSDDPWPRERTEWRSSVDRSMRSCESSDEPKALVASTFAHCSDREPLIGAGFSDSSRDPYRLQRGLKGADPAILADLSGLGPLGYWTKIKRMLKCMSVGLSETLRACARRGSQA